MWSTLIWHLNFDETYNFQTTINHSINIEFISNFQTAMNPIYVDNWTLFQKEYNITYW